MGNQKLKWTFDEEAALRAGVTKHGIGKWKNILKDPDFAPFLTNRSNIDLKDKWRNMGISTGQITREKSKGPRPKPGTAGGITMGQSSSTAVIVIDDDSVDDLSKSSWPKPGIVYGAMVFEAISSINNPMGSEVGEIAASVEERLHEVPENFRRVVTSKLRRLVWQGKVEKVGNRYRIKDAASGTRTSEAKQRDGRTRPSQSFGPGVSSEMVEDASKTAACKVAEAENKSYVAAVAVGEAERVLTLADEMESLVQVIRAIRDDCLRGETFLLAC